MVLRAFSAIADAPQRNQPTEITSSVPLDGVPVQSIASFSTQTIDLINRTLLFHSPYSTKAR
ncbi:hypothetical protein WM40_20585 [Robbsia andropogonis]|uniref:Uncharacterized protein n=1 Tax=Robbsia andropogonis TaxID=28092 RepID=A0A0F5JVJ7_9BURK|nr:hypothetical protein WM40_20585 [Robbsia andropogonis]